MSNPLNRANILASYNDICNGMSDPCACLQIIYDVHLANQPAFHEPYNLWLSDMLCRLRSDFQQAPYTYPIRVTYRLPGIDQQTYNNIIKLKPD